MPITKRSDQTEAEAQTRANHEFRTRLGSSSVYRLRIGNADACDLAEEKDGILGGVLDSEGIVPIMLLGLSSIFGISVKQHHRPPIIKSLV